MSLATRCTACDTVFRVVQDQLKVSEGWVRCGRCNAVFNALEGLFDLEPEPAREPAAEEARAGSPPAPSVAAAPAAVLVEDQASPQEVAPASSPAEAPLPSPSLDRWDPPSPAPRPEPVARDASSADEWDPTVAQPSELPSEPPSEPAWIESRPPPTWAAGDATPASRVAEKDRIDFADARFNAALLADAGMAAESLPSPEDLDAEPAPEFIRKAERKQRWTRPRTVIGLSLLAVLLTAALAVQAALHYRDLLAALWPVSRPALDAMCSLAACRVEPPRRIEDIVIESSSLTSEPAGDAVRLAVVLRNRGALMLAMPAIELSLTDAAGQLIARRVLLPRDFGVAEATIAPASEAALQLTFGTGNRRAAGYTVEPFYP